MQSKLFALIGTTAALAISTGLVASTQATPVPTSSGQPMVLAQGGMASLNLTSDQKTQMRQIRESTRTQIEGILTQEQKNQLNAAREQMRARRQQGGQAGQPGQPGQPGQRGQRGQRGEMWSSLNLTPEQKAQMQRVREESKQRMEAVLTPEQRQQMQQMRQNRQTRRQPQ